MSDEYAKDGHIFVCCACGKTSATRYGFDDVGLSVSTPGWDESCMLNAREFPTANLVWNDSKTRVELASIIDAALATTKKAPPHE